jgi:hypothetical protein
MSNCYALGDVFFDNLLSGVMDAGALFGNVDGASTVEQCFAKGSVTVQRSGSAGAINAGGLAGVQSTGSTISGCAALGASVSVTAPGTNINIGRVAGSLSATSQNNHANNAMRLYNDLLYAPGFPTEVTSTIPANPANNSVHGANAHSGNFGDPTWWTGLGFSTTYWDLNSVGAKGYPRLLASNGTVMGGQ